MRNYQRTFSQNLPTDTLQSTCAKTIFSKTPVVDFVASKVTNQKNLMNFEWINKIRPKAFEIKLERNKRENNDTLSSKFLVSDA